ncbi:BnaUnng01690D [Brassica napus]|uniref:BnaUnng01690D protein n=1 Tax=Brassica napus TaxID=3708 RepID=A0A078JJG7_BRANA|nr:BnaUnng01690D [Brassica napus]
MGASEFRFFLSCDINSPVTFRIDKLDGIPPPSRNPLIRVLNKIRLYMFIAQWNPPRLVSVAEEKKQELYIECALYINGAPFGLPMRTSESPLVAGMGCFLRKTEGLIGGATILLFNSKMQMKSGKQKLRLWQGKEADGSFPTSTPGKVPWHECGELERLEKLMNKFERGQIQSIDWLDRLMLKSLDKIKEQESSKHGNSNLYLVIDFCSFEHRVVFQKSGAKFVTVWDTELGKFNPSEHKQLKLARSLDRGIIDRDLKPSNAERK